MKTQAAVLVEPGSPLELAELTVPVLQPGQVLVRVRHSGVCHTQLLESRGHRGSDRYLPHCLGHEGSGEVLEVGADVTRVAPGDAVILSWMKGPGREVPGSVYDWNGRSVNAGGITTFGRTMVMSENRVTPLPAGFPLREAALLGCAVPTGFGAVYNTAGLARGESVAVFGAGGIGLCAIAAAAAGGGGPIVAVDVLPSKRDLARRMGATHTVNAEEIDDPAAAIKDICAGGADVAVECSGRPAVMAQALASVRARGGRAVVVGNSRHGETLVVDPRELNMGKHLLGTWGGDNAPGTDFPRYARLIQSEGIALAPLAPRDYGLADINAALDDLEAGRVARPLIDMAD